MEINGYLDGKEVEPMFKTFDHTKYDGYKLDTLEIKDTLTSRKDVEYLIKVLEMHKWCFDKPKQ